MPASARLPGMLAVLPRPQGIVPGRAESLGAMNASGSAGLLRTLRPRSIVVFRALQLGDMLCAVPALRALRRALPQARITLVGLPWASGFAARFGHYIDDFLSFPGAAGLPEQPPDRARWPGFIAAARAQRFDLSIQLHGDGRLTNALVAQLGARRQAGFTADFHGGAADGADHRLFLHYPDAGAEPRRLLRLMALLGAPTDDERLEFPLQPGDAAEWQPYPAVRELAPGSYICLHAGARAAGRRWPPEHFAAVGDALAQQSGLAVVLTGSGPEAELAQRVAAAMRTPAIAAAAPVSVGALAALLAHSRLLVGNDTGASHLAAALRVPSVIVFRNSEVDRWAPLDRERHRAVLDPHAVRVDAVVREAFDLLGRTATR